MGLAAPETPEEIAKAKELDDMYSAGWDDAIEHALEIAMSLCPDKHAEFQRLTDALKEPRRQP